ncbi:hypothetical protein Psta_3362 [Pirellula staleyi DSM 6068]|uniref:Uncharacterized protein n=1 Tax=Pirellula staleyi (strain ATCC 27377 / DSM 6068 / ICPB 4128) TaxID=530564 RepID=D2QXU9_PIRSD|nr:hypothetical protein [Pirellula staleyi]ADB18026.1 hypothetical protein Psta_3362 [Pirellula staleyi DSM 6068]
MRRSAYYIVTFLVIVMLACGASALWAQDPIEGLGKIQPDVKKFMRAKLGHQQSLIEALAMEDFPMLAKHAQEMSLLTHAEVWQVFQTPDYLQHSLTFRRAANSLREAAKKENLEGAALAYVEMTLECVHCHKYVRRARMADFRADEAALRAVLSPPAPVKEGLVR